MKKPLNLIAAPLAACVLAAGLDVQASSWAKEKNSNVEPAPAVESNKDKGQFSYLPAQPADSTVPRLDAEVVMENDYCVYQNQVPFVKTVKWDNPKVKQAMRKLGPGWRSTIVYSDWKRPYALENENVDDEKEKRNRVVRNFMRVLCGEFRDYPRMIEAKIDAIRDGQHYASNEEMTSVDTSKNLFSQITYPAYEKMVRIMRVMHSHRQDSVRSEQDGFNYSFGEYGGSSRRVENSVAPWTHCEMKFMFETYMVKDAPMLDGYGWSEGDKPEDYERKYEEYKASKCTPEDFEWMYNFRGHKNYKALEFESNAFVWNSLRGNKELAVRTARGDENANEYYLRPFANRYVRSRMALGSYAFYQDEDHRYMRQASEYGGGPIMYVTDQDTDQNGISDYRLFRDTRGCGDQGLGGNNPGQNCNMVAWETAAAEPNTTGAADGWDVSSFWSPDMGFMSTFESFEERMARMNVALDRHTNWGPTAYYMLDATKPDAKVTQFRGAYSPIVACSYDISASHSFASGDYPTTHPYESGKTKWMFIIRFPAKNYYDEKDLKAGKPFDWNVHYFNETSLSNDYYGERALDRFGFVPHGDVYANVYFVYGAQSWGGDESLNAQQIEALFEDIPAPAAE